MTTIPASDRSISYAPVAATGPFPVDFPVFEETGADLRVTLDGEEVAGWTFSGTRESGFYGDPNTWINGSITFAAPITGALIIDGLRDPRRQGQYAEGRGLPARDMNTELNILTATDQELRRDSDRLSARAVLVPNGESPVVLPDVAERSNKVQAYDETGEPIARSIQPTDGIFATVPEAEEGEREGVNMDPMLVKASVATNAKFGLGLDTATITREEVAGVDTAVWRGDRLQITNSTDDVTILRAENALFQVDAEATDTGYWNGIVGAVTNSTSPDTTVFPTGVTGIGCNRSEGSTAFGLYAEAIARAAGVVTNEIDSFNYYGLPDVAYPPNRGIGISAAMPIAMTLAAGGHFPSFIACQIGKEGSEPQQFYTGIYTSPDGIAYYGIFVDATATEGPGVSCALNNTGSTANNVNLLLQMKDTTPDPAAKFIGAADGNGFGVFGVYSDGSTEAKDYLFLDGSTALDNLAWTAYTPSVTPASGTITTLGTCTGRYKKIGKTVHWNTDITITTNGTGSGGINVTLPGGLVPAYDASGVGREKNITGGIIQAIFTAGSGSVGLVTYNNTYPAGNNHRIVASGTYEVA